MSFNDVPPPYEAAQESAPAFTLSSWIRRVGGAVIDRALVFIVSFVVSFVFSILGSDSLAETLGSLAGLAFLVWQLIVQGNTGQTIGKKAIGISVVRESDARPIGPVISIARFIAHFLDAIICLLGFLLPLVDKKRQTIADKLLQTVVIDVPKN